MKDVWKTLKLGLYVIALPLVATAAASAHQWITNNEPVTEISVPTAVVSSSTVARVNAIRNHTVTLNDEGEIQGRIATINPESTEAFGMTNMSIYFVRNGEVVEKTDTNADGSFVATGVAEGVYSFIASGESGFSTFGVNVVKTDGDSQNYLEVAAISPNLETMKEIVANGLPKKVADQVAADMSQVQSLQPSEFAGTNRVQLTESGLLNGRVVSLVKNELEGMNAHLLQGSQKIAQVAIQANGEFSVSDLEPGVYDLVAVGQDGIAAVSFEAVAFNNNEVDETYTALQDIVYDSVDVALAQPVDAVFIGGACSSCGGGTIDNSIVYDSAPIEYAQGSVEYASSPIEYAGESVCGGVACGSSCGGCGNFSGFTSSGCCGGSRGFGGFGGRLGGGIGRRLGILGLIGGIIAVAVSDDDDDVIVSPNDS